MIEKARLFIASPIQSPAFEPLDAIYAQREAISARIPNRIRWVPTDQWHLTWLFLGSVETARIASIQAGLQAALSAIKPTPAELEDVVYWPKPRKPTMIVCRIKHDPKLLRVHQAICRELPDYPADKAFNPHITLARLKEPLPSEGKSKPGWVFSPLQSVSWLIDQVTLYSSHLTPQGAIYSALYTVPLTP